LLPDICRFHIKRAEIQHLLKLVSEFLITLFHWCMLWFFCMLKLLGLCWSLLQT
jgi:hypothetical protein